MIYGPPLRHISKQIDRKKITPLFCCYYISSITFVCWKDISALQPNSSTWNSCVLCIFTTLSTKSHPYSLLLISTSRYASHNSQTTGGVVIDVKGHILSDSLVFTPSSQTTDVNSKKDNIKHTLSTQKP